jgi:hypothetical protein
MQCPPRATRLLFTELLLAFVQGTILSRAVAVEAAAMLALPAIRVTSVTMSDGRKFIRRSHPATSDSPQGFSGVASS